MWIVQAKTPSGQWLSSIAYATLEQVCFYMSSMARNGCKSFRVKKLPVLTD